MSSPLNPSWLLIAKRQSPCLVLVGMMGKEEAPLSRSVRRASVIVVLILFAVGFTASAYAQANNPPRHPVDAAWPKPLPND